MYERFTERARQAVEAGQASARRHKHNYVGTEHLLVGLLADYETITARSLFSLGVTPERVDRQITRIVGEGQEAIEGELPFTPRSKKVLELALREALSLGHNYVGTEHVLLGLVRENEGVAARILLDFDADSEKIRNEVLSALNGKSQAEPEVDEEAHLKAAWKDAANGTWGSLQYVMRMVVGAAPAKAELNRLIRLYVSERLKAEGIFTSNVGEQ